MLNMADKTRKYIEKNCKNIPMDRAHMNDLLDCLDDLMLDSLDENYDPTEETRVITKVYDDLYYNND